MATLPVASDLSGREMDGPASEAVGKSGLACTRRAEEHHRCARLEKTAEGIHSCTGEGADGHDVTGTDQPLGRLDGSRDVLADVRLGQHHDGGSTTLPGQYQETLEAPGSEAALERADYEYLVDVRREHLRSLRTPGTATHDGAAPRQHVCDQTALKHDPVADSRCLQGVGVMSKLGSDKCSQLTGLGENRESAAVDPSDAAWHGALDELASERGLEGQPPAEIGKGRAPMV